MNKLSNNCTCEYMHARMYESMYACTYVCTYVCLSFCIYIYADVYESWLKRRVRVWRVLAEAKRLVEQIKAETQSTLPDA